MKGASSFCFRSTGLCHHFVICTGRGERQVQAIADAVAIEAGRRPIGV